jgi:hypothetical protein
VLGLSGCGKKEVDTDDDQPRGKYVSGRDKGASGGASTGAAAEPLKAPLDGVIRGRVVLEGEKPVMAVIPTMATHNDHAVCLAGDEAEKRDPKWIIGKDNGVANVVVFLKPPQGKYFLVKDEDKNLSGKNKEMDQPHCAFVPHVVAAFPSYRDGKDLKSTGQELVVKNSAPVPHNTKWQGDTLKTGGGSRTIPPKGDITIKLVPEANPIKIACDFHPWMYARVWAFEHPYFAVTKEDGAFEIKNVPTGAEVGLVAWHEAPGFFYGGASGTKKKFNPGENKVDLTISAK